MVSLYEGAKARFRVDSELSEKLEVNVVMYPLSPFLFEVVVYVLTKFAKDGALIQLLYADE